MFRQWWRDSYSTPPGNHALMTHLGWGRYLLQEAARRQKEGASVAPD